tara:strand:+ start:46 stop:1065 length:1020 start_codon:yes stop_codon:yes gene_type:complete
MASSIQHPAAETDGKEQPVESPLYAAIDVGSNNLRLLVASLNEKGEPRVVDAFSRAIRLGAHLNDDGNIDPVALEKAANALRICAGKVRRAGVRRYRAVATEICRQAKNQRDFIDHIRQRTRLNVEIISCAEEARLAMMGVSPLVDEHITDCLVFDIGGASSEIVWGQKQDDGSLKLIDHISLPFGVITLGDRIDESEASRRASYDMLRTELQVAFMEAEQRWKLRDRVMAGKVQVIGASGTVTTLAGILLDLTKYSRNLVDGTDLKTADAAAVISKLLSQPPQLRAKHGCIGFNRCEMVLPGCAVFEAIIGIWPVDKVRVADRGVREGILLDLSRQYG